MTAWWYAEHDKKVGPADIDELKRLLETGRIGLKTVLWREGMEAWRPLDEIDELSTLKGAVPPPLPAKTHADPLTYPLADRWPRFFARIFDVSWEVLIVSFALSAVLGRYSARFLEWINEPGADLLFGILSLPIALLFDAFLYRAAGNTPGKALLGLTVTTLDGRPLSFVEYLGRNFSMWASGLALGFPLINLFTMATQSRRLSKGQQASYDEPTGFRVRAKPSRLTGKIIFGVVFASLFVVMAVLRGMEQTAQREATLNRALQDYSWENPVTRRIAKIDSRWKHAAQLNPEGQELYVFSEQTDRTVVILGVENAPSYTLDDYVRAFQKGTAASMRFSDGGRFFQRDGIPTWEGSGRMAESTSNRLHVQVVQVGPRFWRVVTIQAMPYDYSDAFVAKLRAAVWATVE